MGSKSHNIGAETAATIAPLLGGHAVVEHPHDTWRGVVMLADGVKLIFASDFRGNGKGEVIAFLPRPGMPGESARLGVIGASFTRDPAKLAADIERRLLVPAREKAVEVRNKWAEFENAAEHLESLQEGFSVIADVKSELVDAKKADQRLAVRYYSPEKGSLSAEITAHGSVFVRHVSISSASNEVDALVRLICALSE